MQSQPDYSREVHCLLGLPFDAINLEQATQRIRGAIDRHTPCFLSTPNLNFLIAAQSDTAFRDSVVHSDLSVADGMPIVWMAKLLGIPLQERVAGSDLFEQLRQSSSGNLSVYFFGGPEGVAEIACNQLTASPSAMRCAGFASPGFGSLQDMSDEQTIRDINASQADFLVVALGAKKGQAWIEYNRRKLTPPVISHLGAVVNFVAGRLDRAPVWVRRTGCEWLWRIKEEPGLWRRYATDGWKFAKLFLSRVLPHAYMVYRHKSGAPVQTQTSINTHQEETRIVLHLSGNWHRHNLQPLRLCFEDCARRGQNIVLDLQHTDYVDSAFMGLLQLLHADLHAQKKSLSCRNAGKSIRRIFKYTCTEYLLNHH